MPRPPRPNATPRPTRSRGERAGFRIEVWLTAAERAAVSRALGRDADAAGVRSLALAAAVLVVEDAAPVATR